MRDNLKEYFLTIIIVIKNGSITKVKHFIFRLGNIARINI